MGKSKPWPEAMEAITGQREMSADAIMRYFAPLMDWLQEQNEQNEERVGWPGHWEEDGNGRDAITQQFFFFGRKEMQISSVIFHEQVFTYYEDIYVYMISYTLYEP